MVFRFVSLARRSVPEPAVGLFSPMHHGCCSYYLNSRHAADPISVLDLCREFYVSRRTLQNIFTQVLGVGPNAWLKMVRLNAVRRELLNPTSKHFTVKDAAMHWGFWHLSQFAMDYQQFFKELPSMTRQLRGQRAH